MCGGEEAVSELDKAVSTDFNWSYAVVVGEGGKCEPDSTSSDREMTVHFQRRIRE